MTAARPPWRSIPATIWALGFVSLFMDVSSELVHSLLPLFLVTSLGTSVTSVGVLEGFAEATALIVKIFSGALSDYLGKRKWLALAGYGMAAFTKPMFPLATSFAAVFAARFLDRIGKGIRGAPRDALVGELAPPEIRGACFGLRQSLDTVGAFVGPVLAIGLMVLFAGDIRRVLWIAVITAFIAVVVLLFGVHEPTTHHSDSSRPPLRLRDIGQVGGDYWRLTIIAAVLTLAQFSEAFLLLKAQSAGFAPGWAPLVMVVMNVAFMLSAYPAGAWSDRSGRRPVLLAGIALLVAADLTLAAGDHWGWLAGGVILWGLHLGFTQGLFAALIADATQPAIRGTAYGVFHFISGIAMLIASSAAGWLWDAYGPAATFMTGAGLATAAFVALLVAFGSAAKQTE